MDTTFWDNFGKPTVHIDEFYENEACEDGLVRLLEGRERQEEFTFQDILEGHNILEDICWFIVAMIDAEFNVDHRRVAKLVLDYATTDKSHPDVLIERSQSCIDKFVETGHISPRDFDIAARVASVVSFIESKDYASGAHKLLNYINNNWNTHK